MSKATKTEHNGAKNGGGYWGLWYNTERPHHTLKLKSPMRALLDGLQLPLAESNMLWTNTAT